MGRDHYPAWPSLALQSFGYIRLLMERMTRMMMITISKAPTEMNMISPYCRARRLPMPL